MPTSPSARSGSKNETLDPASPRAATTALRGSRADLALRGADLPTGRRAIAARLQRAFSIACEIDAVTLGAEVQGTGADGYRRLEAELFDTAAACTGLSDAALAGRLRPKIPAATITAATIRRWRQGTEPAPMIAFLATCDLARLRLALVRAQLRSGVPEQHRPAGPPADGRRAR